MEGFHNRLKLLRKKNNFKLNEVAQRINVTPSALSQYESGKRTPKYDKLIKLAQLYDTNIEYLLNGEKPNTNIIYYSLDKDNQDIMVAAPNSDNNYHINDKDKIKQSAYISSLKAKLLFTISKIEDNDKQQQILENLLSLISMYE